jgi:phosphatidylinositol alpha-1,6-mannosyltransferase
MTTPSLNQKDHLLLTLEYPPFCGGVGTYLFNLFSVGEYQVLVNGKGEGQISFFYKYFWPRWLKIFFYLLRKVCTFKVLHISHVLPLGYVAYLLKIFAAKKYVIYLHGLDFNLMKSSKWKAFLGKKILRSAAMIVTNSKFLQIEVRQFLNGKNPLMKVIYPAPHRELLGLAGGLLNVNRMQSLRQKYQISDDDKIILSTGRLVERKGQALLIKALSENWPANLKYFIVGRGPEEANLRHLIGEYRLEKQAFVLTGVDKTEELADFYRLANLFVLPTLELGADVEGFGIVFIEAGLFGKAVIAGQGRGVAEAVLHQKTGIVLEYPRDLANLRENVLNLLNNNEKRRQLAEASREWARRFIYSENYLWKILSDNLK